LSWVVAQGIGTALIEPGKPWQNGVTESFNGKFRDECLSLEWFRSRAEAKVIIEAPAPQGVHATSEGRRLKLAVVGRIQAGQPVRSKRGSVQLLRPPDYSQHVLSGRQIIN
jgi:Integrase core domain